MIHKQIRAFSLIELLTVMAVMGLLLAILVPSLNAARHASRRLACQTNLRQLALAWRGYLDDFNGAFYQGINANLDYGGWIGEKHWAARPLNSFVGLGEQAPESPDEARLFACPADGGDIPGTLLSAYRYFGTSYQTNPLLIGQDQVSTRWIPTAVKPLHEHINARLKGVNRNRVGSPARLLLMGDYGWVNQWMPGNLPRTEWHNRGGFHDLAFLDGHVDFIEIHKGAYVSEEYTVLPFTELHTLALEGQVEE